jgi:hypothetical protein
MQDYDYNTQDPPPGYDDDTSYLNPRARRVTGPRGRKLMQDYDKDTSGGDRLPPPPAYYEYLFRKRFPGLPVPVEAGRKLMQLSPAEASKQA